MLGRMSFSVYIVALEQCAVTQIRDIFVPVDCCVKIVPTGSCHWERKDSRCPASQHKIKTKDLHQSSSQSGESSLAKSWHGEEMDAGISSV